MPSMGPAAMSIIGPHDAASFSDMRPLILLLNAQFWRLGAVILFFGVGSPLRAEAMRASFYGSESGHRTASGAPFRPSAFTAAHRNLPFGTRLRVCLVGCVAVTVTDRGPFARGRSLDLSRAAARAIGLEAAGVAVIDVEILGRRR